MGIFNCWSNLFNSSKRKWQAAQAHEFKFWEGISQTGYNNLDPENFIKEGQKEDMLRALDFLEVSHDFWQDKFIVEFGPGPAGIIEYVEAETKIGIEPLYEEYKKVFPHLSKSKVKYLTCPAEEASEVTSQSADLVVCYNMLDHVIDPKKVLDQIRRIMKPSATLLFQINVFDSINEIEKKEGLHAELHPHSFTRDSLQSLLREFAFELIKESISDSVNECNEKFYICSLRLKSLS